MKTRSIIILLLIGAALLFTFNLWDKGGVPPPGKQQVVNSERQAVLLESAYQRANVLLQVHSDSLQRKLFYTQEKLKAAQLSLRNAQSRLLALAGKKAEHVQEQLSDCDSLKEQAGLFSEMVDSVAGWYECDILQLGLLLATRDSQLVVCRSSYAKLNDLTREQAQREQKLTEDLQVAYRAQRRKIVQNKMLAGGFLMLSGISTMLYINSRQ